MGYQSTHLLTVVCKLGLADLLRDGPRDSTELASLTGANVDALHRVLRALAQLGVLEQSPVGRFALTPIGDCLRSNRPDSLCPVALFHGHEMIQRAWGEMLYSVMTGDTAFEQVFGMPAFDYLEANPEAAAIYDAGMGQMTARTAPEVVAAYDFADFDTIVDVGGGAGVLLAEILRGHPRPRGIVFDLPHACPSAENTMRDAGLVERMRFEGGDFFKSISAGGDCYVLRHIVHDWGDGPVGEILRSCRQVVPAHGRLLLVEAVMPAEGEPGREYVMLDIMMLVRVGGRERTEAEYRTLIERAGFHLERVIPTSARFSILECMVAT